MRMNFPNIVQGVFAYHIRAESPELSDEVHEGEGHSDSGQEEVGDGEVGNKYVSGC